MGWHTLWKWQPSSPFAGDNEHSPYRAEQPGEPDSLGDDIGADVVLVKGEPTYADSGEIEEADLGDLSPLFNQLILLKLLEVKEGAGTQHLFQFGDWFSFVQQAETGDTTMPAKIRASRERGDSWAGSSFQEAIRLAKVGWPEGVKRIQDKINVINTHIPAKRVLFDMSTDVVGPGTVDMERYQQGHPEPYVVFKPNDQQTEGTKIVRILYNNCVSAYIDPDEIFDKGALVCALIDILERSGKRVELNMVSKTSAWSGNSINVTIPIKQAQDPLDLDRIAFALCHAGCFRRLIFSVWEQAPLEYRKVCGIEPNTGYGHVTTHTDPDQVTIDSNAIKDNKTLQLKWLREMLKEQGIEIEID